MSQSIWPCGAFAAVTLLAALCQAQKPTWVYENGQWPQVNQVAPQPVSDPIIDRAEAALASGATETCRQILFPWEKDHKDSPIRDRCIYMLAESYFKDDDRILAFYYLDEVMDEYPESPLFNSAINLQYTIADDYLNGHKRRFFNLPILPAEDEAVEMMYRIQQRSPGSTLAEKALLRTADYYYNSGQFDYAADTFGAYVRSYPRGKSIVHSKLRQAFSDLAQFRGLLFDPTCIVDARQELVDFAQTYPDIAQDEQVQVFIDRIDSAFAGKLLSIADYYQRTGELRASAYYMEFLIQTYGDSAEAAVARGRLQHYPAWATAPPTPPRTGGYASELETTTH